jgi:hypothetical protein
MAVQSFLTGFPGLHKKKAVELFVTEFLLAYSVIKTDTPLIFRLSLSVMLFRRNRSTIGKYREREAL